MKPCSLCKQQHERMMSNGRCRPCHLKWCRDYRYGKGAGDWFDRRIAKNGEVCDICSEPSQTDKGLHLDHDNLTGRWRGVLCAICNAAVATYETYHRQEETMKLVERYLDPSW